MENLVTSISFSLQYALGWMVIHSLWQITAIAFISGILMLIMRKKPAQWRYIIGNVALVAILVSAFLTFNFYYKNENNARENAINIQRAATETNNNEVLNANKNSDKNNTLTAAKTNTNPVKVEEASENTAPLSWDMFKTYFNKNIPLILTLWLLGMSLFLLKLLGSISYVYYIKSKHNFPVDDYWFDKLISLKNSLKIGKAVDLVESALVRSPVVVGHLKPIVLFPIGIINRLSPEEVEAILAHELAHIARHDYVFNILQSIVEALFYYHPAMWWLSAQVRNERESACDEMAISLTGDSMQYAKTLVTVQEMAYYPLSTSLAFAGQSRKNQFLLRIQRILNQKQNNNVMEKLIATTLIIGSLVVITFGQMSKKQQKDNLNLNLTEDSFIKWGDAPLSMTGFWNAEIQGEEVRVQFNHNMEHGNWTTTRRFKKSEFSAMPTSESDFSIKREAGVMNFKGKFEGNEGYGKFKFEESADFKTYLASQGIENVKEEMMMHLFMANINKDYIAYLKSNGYDRISKSELQDLAIHGLSREDIESYLTAFKKYKSELSLEKLVELRIHGVNAKFQKELNDAGFIDVPLEQVLAAKIHGVNGEFLTNLKSAGYNPESLENVIEFKIHGVTGDFIKKISASSKRTLSHDEIVEAKIHGLDKIDVEKIRKSGIDPDNEDLKSFAIHGVDADFIEKMNNAGFGKLSSEDLLAAKIHGVTPELVKAYSEMGYKDMSFQRVLDFKIHGITAEYVKEMAATGYANLSPNRIVEFKIHGITPQYVKTVSEMGFKDLAPNKIVEMKIHGVTPEFVKSVYDMGFKDLPFNKIVEMKIHGITPDFIKSFTDAGYKDVPMQKFIEMKIHGVTPSFINGFKEMGFKDISLSKAVEAKIHGVTPQYIKQMQEKGFKKMDLDEYIRMKIYGFGN